MPTSHSHLLTAAPDSERAVEADWETDPEPSTFVCDICEKTFTGKAPGSGLLLWTRGDELRFEEPPLCEGCSDKLLLGALRSFTQEEESE